MTKQEIIYEYERVLLGKKGKVDSEILCFSPSQNESLAIEVFRYAFEEIMHWTPWEAENGLTAEKIKLLKLTSFVKQINFPPEFNPDADFYYIVSKVYPDIIKINVKERALVMYQNLLSGKIKKFPKRFTEGRDGEMRALFCLKYAIKNYGTFDSVEDLYRAFSGVEGVSFLKKMKLNQASTTIFEYPIDYLHASFSEEEQVENEFLYFKYRFRVYERDIAKQKLNEERRLRKLQEEEQKRINAAENETEDNMAEEQTDEASEIKTED